MWYPTGRIWWWSVLAAAVLVTSASGNDPKSAKPPKAPGDAVIFDHDKAGAYFIARPLKEQYDSLQKRVEALRAEIREAKIDAAKAHTEIAALQAELKTLLNRIDATKLYIPGARVQTRTETTTIPLGPDDLLFIEAENVEIVGRDGPGIECVLEKTVLDQDGSKLDAEFAGIELVSRPASGAEFFGYYKAISGRPSPEDKATWEHFPFKGFVDRTFPYVTVKGLNYQEGNRSISLEMSSEKGEAMHSSSWRRQVKLTLRVPRCRLVGVRGARGRFRVENLDASLAVQGDGNRDYSAVYRVANLGGSLTAENLPIHQIEGVRGNVSVDATAYAENRRHPHGPDGQSVRSDTPKPSLYRDIRGDLRARFCRADLTLETITGRVDVENDFGNTLWRLDTPVDPTRDHRVVTQSGTVELPMNPKALGKLPLALYTECGVIHLARGIDSFKDLMFESAEGDVARRSWDAQIRNESSGPNLPPGGAFTFFRRVADTLHGRPRSAGADVISRSGTITVTPAVTGQR